MMRYNTQTIVNGLLGIGGEVVNTERSSVPVLLAFGLVFVAGLGIVLWQLNRRARRFRAVANEPFAELAVHDLTVGYGSRAVLQNVSFVLKPGRLYGLVGPNGSGKSTLIKSLLGLVPVQQGTLRVNGKPVQLSGLAAYVPQRETLDWQFPATVWDIVLTGQFGPLPALQKLRAEQRQLAQQALENVGLWELRHRQIGELSGGQQQRMFMARALCQQAPLLVLDEPFTGIDAATEELLTRLLRELAHSGTTVLIVHHDLNRARELFDEVLLLGQHQLQAQGPAAEVLTPENLLQVYGLNLAPAPAWAG
jgi:ABC-type Mn2+/Zn2+ transport system ATPase subunit